MKTRSVENYISIVNLFLKHGKKAPDKCNLSDIQNYIVNLKVRGSAINTQRLNITVLKSFFKWLAEQTGTLDISKSIRPIREQIRIPDLPTPDDILKISFYIMEKYRKSQNQSRKFVYLRDITFILFLVDSGLRISEALSLRNLHIKKAENHLQAVVNDTKGYYGRIVNLAKLSSEYLIPEMMSYYILYRQQALPYCDTDYFFPRSMTELNKPLNRTTILSKIVHYWRRANLPGHVTPHTLRHFFGTYSVLNGADLFTVKSAMGHRHLSTTERYIHLAEITKSKIVDHSPGRLMKSPEGFSGFVDILKGLNP